MLLLLKALPHSSHLYFFRGGGLNGLDGRLVGMPGRGGITLWPPAVGLVTEDRLSTEGADG